jgi:FlaA1/EpsC-like NDP-sugar epimerase
MNIAITGATGNIGSVLVDNLLRECKPAKIALFCRDD